MYDLHYIYKVPYKINHYYQNFELANAKNIIIEKKKYIEAGVHKFLKSFAVFI